MKLQLFTALQEQYLKCVEQNLNNEQISGYLLPVAAEQTPQACAVAGCIPGRLEPRGIGLQEWNGDRHRARSHTFSFSMIWPKYGCRLS